MYFMMTRMLRDLVEVLRLLLDCNNMCSGRCFRGVMNFQAVESSRDCALLVSKSVAYATQVRSLRETR